MVLSPLAKQLYVTLVSSCTTFTNGYTVGLLSSLLPALRAPESPIRLSPDDESWLPAITFLLMFPSQFISGILTRHFGRRIFVTLSLVPMLLANLILYFATNFAMLFAGCLLAGLVGGGMAVCHMMLAEMLSPRYRAVFLNVKTGAGFAGVGLAHVLGNYCDWRALSLYGAIVPLVAIITSLTIPESPAWLAAQGRFEESRMAFIWLRGLNEAEELRHLIEKQVKELARHLNEKQNKKPWWIRFRTFVSDRGFLKAISISLTTVVLIEASGKQMFTIFAIDIIRSILGTEANPYMYAIVMDVTDAVSVVLSCFALHYCSRRRLFFVTGVIANILLFAFCVCVYLSSLSFIPHNLSWISLGIYGMYILILGVGVLPVAFILLGEIIPLSHRGEGVAVNSFVFVSLMFVVAKQAPGLVRAWGLAAVFLLHTIIMSVSLLYLYIAVPETDRKTLQNIEQEIKGETPGEEMQEFITENTIHNVQRL